MFEQIPIILTSMIVVLWYLYKVISETIALLRGYKIVNVVAKYIFILNFVTSYTDIILSSMSRKVWVIYCMLRSYCQSESVGWKLFYSGEDTSSITEDNYEAMNECNMKLCCINFS